MNYLLSEPLIETEFMNANVQIKRVPFAGAAN